MAKKQMTVADVGGWGQKALHHWKEFCPRRVKALGPHLLEACQKAEADAEAYYNQLLKAGYSPLEAGQMAEREFLVLPDFGEE
jgi:hypothetical protein